MTRARVALVVAALTALGCGSAETADSHASDAGAEAAGDAAPDAAAFPGCPTGDGGFLVPTFTEKRVSAGFYDTCGIRDDGTVACWGIGDPVDAPPAGKFVRVSAGAFHACGIRTSGEVECWGSGKTSDVCPPDCGQSTPPPGKFIELAAGYDLTCGLRPDCTLECWGNVSQLGTPGGQFVQVDAWVGAAAVDASSHIWPSPPGFGIGLGPYAPRDSLKQVSLSDRCICYLYANKQADCWLARQDSSPPYYRIDTWTPSGVAAVSCGVGDACAILDDGTIACKYGAGPSGTFTELSCGFGFCCGMRTDGTALCYGGGASDMPPDFPKGP